MWNPYVDLLESKFEYVDDNILSTDGYEKRSSKIDLCRWDLVHTYSWAIPNKKAIETIVNRGPVVEIGAGSGYWSHLIELEGGDAVAFDNKDRNYRKVWNEVGEKDSTIASKYSHRTMLMCWPEYSSEMGETAVEAYDGDSIILIGESVGGCTGTDKMYNMIQDEYELVEEVDIPNWYGIKDRLYVYDHY